MKDFWQLVLANYASLCIIVGLGIILIVNRNLDKRINKYFIVYDILVLLLCIVEISDVYLRELETPSILRYFTSAIGYTIRPATIAVIIMIFLRKRDNLVFLWIPILILGILVFTSYFAHLVFYFSDKNSFQVGPFRLLPHIISLIYLVVLIILTIKMLRFHTSSEIIALFFVVFACALATILETLDDEGNKKFLLIGAMSASCVIYYTVLYVESNKIDILTGLKNRRCFLLMLKKWKTIT